MNIFDNILIFRYVRYHKFNNFDVFHIFNNFDIFNIFDCGGQTSKRAGGQACGRANFKTKSTPKHNSVFQFCSSKTRNKTQCLQFVSSKTRKIVVVLVCSSKIRKQTKNTQFFSLFLRPKTRNKLNNLVFQSLCTQNQVRTKKLSFLVFISFKTKKLEN